MHRVTSLSLLLTLLFLLSTWFPFRALQLHHISARFKVNLHDKSSKSQRGKARRVGPLDRIHIAEGCFFDANNSPFWPINPMTPHCFSLFYSLTALSIRAATKARYLPALLAFFLPPTLYDTACNIDLCAFLHRLPFGGVFKVRHQCCGKFSILVALNPWRRSWLELLTSPRHGGALCSA